MMHIIYTLYIKIILLSPIFYQRIIEITFKTLQNMYLLILLVEGYLWMVSWLDVDDRIRNKDSFVLKAREHLYIGPKKFDAFNRGMNKEP